jgi:hypothetical protein
MTDGATNAGKTRQQPPPRLAIRMLRTLWRPHNRGLVLTAAVVLVAIGGARYGWRRWGETPAHAPEYLVTPAKIWVTPVPAWIHCDLKA